jgi:hypothetical protein
VRFPKCLQGSSASIVTSSYAVCVPAGVPGSHKSNVVLPPHYVDLSVHIDSAVRKVPAAAGDCIIFTEGLTHGAVCLALPELQQSNERYRRHDDHAGTLPWTTQDRTRTTLFYKCHCTFSMFSFAGPEVIDSTSNHVTLSHHVSGALDTMSVGLLTAGHTLILRNTLSTRTWPRTSASLPCWSHRTPGEEAAQKRPGCGAQANRHACDLY